jgi:hypothetical protein
MPTIFVCAAGLIHFEQYGPVMSVEVMRDWNMGDFCGFTFVVFMDISKWLM